MRPNPINSAVGTIAYNIAAVRRLRTSWLGSLRVGRLAAKAWTLTDIAVLSLSALSVDETLGNGWLGPDLRLIGLDTQRALMLVLKRKRSAKSEAFGSVATSRRGTTELAGGTAGDPKDVRMMRAGWTSISACRHRSKFGSAGNGGTIRVSPVHVAPQHLPGSSGFRASVSGASSMTPARHVVLIVTCSRLDRPRSRESTLTARHFASA